MDNQLQNIGGVEASGADFRFTWSSRPTRHGDFRLGFDATYLDDYTELSKNPDGSLTSNDRTGTITNETFQRAFPEWRAVQTLDWSKERWGGSLVNRYVHDMLQTSGNNLSSRTFTDVSVRYKPPVANDSLTAVFGVNNIFDTDPATCDSCGVIGMAPIVHDLPGTVVFARLEWTMAGGM